MKRLIISLLLSLLSLTLTAQNNIAGEREYIDLGHSNINRYVTIDIDNQIRLYSGNVTNDGAILFMQYVKGGTATLVGANAQYSIGPIDCYRFSPLSVMLVPFSELPYAFALLANGKVVTFIYNCTRPPND